MFFFLLFYFWYFLSFFDYILGILKLLMTQHLLVCNNCINYADTIHGYYYVHYMYENTLPQNESQYYRFDIFKLFLVNIEHHNSIW